MPDLKITMGTSPPNSTDHGSFFGHDIKLQGLHLVRLDRPAHLVLTLDNNDPMVRSLDIDVGPVIRLVHPFFYDQAVRFCYRHHDRDTIEFPDFSEPPFERSLRPEDGWPSPNFPETLPTREVKIIELRQKPQRHKNKRNTIDDFSTIFAGSESPTVQNHSQGQCAACSSDGLQLIASLPNRPVANINIWRNDFVFVLFWFCRSCKSITTHNECD
jgi:hypothetical protein